MDVDIIETDQSLPTDRAWVVSMTIKSFKGRKDVDVHLFRSDYDEAEMETYDWDKILGDPYDPEVKPDPELSKCVLLEAFTSTERDALLAYLKERYEDRVSAITACPLNLPIPLGLPPLSSIPEGKAIGFIRFDQIPNYTLDFPVHGFYDLAQHEPMVHDEEGA